MILRLTNADAGSQGRPIALNTAYIVAVFSIFENETRVRTSDGEEYIVSESFDDIGAKWRADT